MVDNLIRLVLVEISARKREISVTDRELQEAADSLRKSLGLNSAGDTFTYLKQVGLEVEDLEFLLVSELLYHKLKRSLSGADAVQEVFTEYLHMFETVELAGLSFDSMDEAEKFYRGLIEGESEFPDPLATRSEDPGGVEAAVHIGLVTRADLGEEAAARVFADDPPEFVGPFESEGRYWIYHILLPKRAEITEDVYAICEDLIVQDFLHHKHTDILGRFNS